MYLDVASNLLVSITQVGHEIRNVEEFNDFKSLAMSVPPSPRPFSPGRPSTSTGKRINILRLEENHVSLCLKGE